MFATYGRSLYALVVGLLTGRWVLMALGADDFGLYGVVGGLTVFISFLSGLSASAIARFYAFHLGAAETVAAEEGIEECRKWFNTAFLIHTSLPVLLIMAGYPFGVWAIRSYLTIPIDRVDVCIWVWRFACVSCFVGMASVPFQAMFTAKQEIKEITLYSIASTTLNFFFLLYVVNHPSTWLFGYALWMCLLVTVPQIVISIRAVIRYPECRLVYRYLWNGGRLREVLTFAGAKFLGSLSQMFCSQGTAILVNKILGPTCNAAMTMGNSVCGHCSTLSSAFVGALTPAITSAAGAGDCSRLVKLIYLSCSATCAAVLVFAIPLMIEIDEVMVLWLKTPPAGTGSLCFALLITVILDRVSDGLWIGIFAVGKILAFQTVESILWFVVLPVAYFFIELGYGVAGVGYAMVVAKFFAIGVKLYYARRICGVSVRHWWGKIFLPLCLVSIAGFATGHSVQQLMGASLLRIVLVSIAVELVLIPMLWFVAMPYELKTRIRNQVLGWRCRIMS